MERPSYIPSWIPHYCEVQYGAGNLCGNTPVIEMYIPANNIQSAMFDKPKSRIKFSCALHPKYGVIGTIEEVFRE